MTVELHGVVFGSVGDALARVLGKEDDAAVRSFDEEDAAFHGFLVTDERGDTLSGPEVEQRRAYFASLVAAIITYGRAARGVIVPTVYFDAYAAGAFCGVGNQYVATDDDDVAEALASQIRAMVEEGERDEMMKNLRELRAHRLSLVEGGGGA